MSAIHKRGKEQQDARKAVLSVSLYPNLHRQLVAAYSPALGIFLHQLCYWFSRPGMANREDLYKTRQEMEEETGLKRRQQDKARKQARMQGVLKERRGAHNRIIYQPDWIQIAETLNLEISLHTIGEQVEPKNDESSSHTIGEQVESAPHDVPGNLPAPSEPTHSLDSALASSQYIQEGEKEIEELQKASRVALERFFGNEDAYTRGMLKRWIEDPSSRGEITEVVSLETGLPPAARRDIERFMDERVKSRQENGRVVTAGQVPGHGGGI